MAKQKLDVDLTCDGADDAWVVIDGQDVSLARGYIEVDTARPNHRYVLWVEGPPGGSATLKIDQGPDNLVNSTCTINWGNTEQVEHNDFALK